MYKEGLGLLGGFYFHSLVVHNFIPFTSNISQRDLQIFEARDGRLYKHVDDTYAHTLQFSSFPKLFTTNISQNSRRRNVCHSRFFYLFLQKGKTKKENPEMHVKLHFMAICSKPFNIKGRELILSHPYPSSATTTVILCLFFPPVVR